jgi:hypothetical protein
MKIIVQDNFPAFAKAMEVSAKQARFAAKEALNAVAEKARPALRAEMVSVFDRPTPWVLNSLRIKYATKSNLMAEIAYKDKNSVESSRSMLEPHVFGGVRHGKGMEGRLRALGLLPGGWFAMPGAAAKLDGNGNMSKGQISLLLNVIGAFTEAGYNKANAKTVARLAKGGRKASQYGQYGYEWLVNPVSGSRRIKHLAPGVYQRVGSGFGSSLKPVLIFVSKANYKQRFDFFGVVDRVVRKEFPAEFDRAFDNALRTAKP